MQRLPFISLLVALILIAGTCGPDEPEAATASKAKRKAVQSPAYSFFVDGEPVDPHVYSLEGTPDEPRAGDLIEVDDVLITIGPPGTYRFSTTPWDEGRLLLVEEDGTTRVIGIRVPYGYDGEQGSPGNPLEQLSDSELAGVWGITLRDWDAGMVEKLAAVDAERCCVTIDDKPVTIQEDASPPLPDNLRYLRVSGLSRLAREHTAVLRRMTSLKFFDLRGVGRPMDISLIEANADLRYLDLDGYEVTGAESLRRFRRLRYLGLGYCEGFHEIGFVKEMPALRRLYIHGTEVTDLSPLAGHPSLERVIAANSPVSRLPKAPVPALRTLHIIGTKVSDRTARRFRKANPECRVLHGYVATLEEALAGVTRISVRRGGLGRDAAAEEPTLFEENDPAAVGRVIEHITIDEEQSGIRCGCRGGPTFVFHVDKERTVELSFHHGQHLRWRQWPGDGVLTPESGLFLSKWLADHGIVWHLLEAAGNLSWRRPDGVPALHDAALRGNVGSLESLASRLGNVDRADELGWTALHCAAALGNRRTIECLLEAGADSQRPTAAGTSALDWVVHQGHKPAAEMLLAAGARHTVHTAAGMGDVEALERLLADKGTLTRAGRRFGAPPLHWAVEGGQPEAAVRLLEAGANPNERDVHGRTPLIAAVEEGDTRLTKLLLSRGAEVNVADARRRTPLHVAAEDGERQLAETLLSAGAALETEDSAGQTPLELAVEWGKDPVIDLLLCAGGRWPEEYDDDRIHWAVWNGSAQAVRVLVERGVDLNRPDHEGRTPLHVATVNGRADVVEILTQGGANVDAKDPHDRTALHEAVAAGHKDIIRILLAAGADQRVHDIHHRTPAQIAAHDRRKDILALLTAAEPEARNDALFGAMAAGDTELVRSLISEGADVSARAEDGIGILHVAVGRADKEFLQFLIAKGADVMARTEDGQTPLHSAALGASTDIVAFLIEQGAQVDVHSERGETPLQFAAMAGRPGMVKFLLTKGADVHAADRRGSTALHHAALWNEAEVIRVLTEAGADIHARDETGATPLHRAAMNNQQASVRELLARGADPNAVDHGGDTPLHHAAFAPLGAGAIELLLSNGAELNARNKEGQTPLQKAHEYNSVPAIRILTEHGAEK